MRGRLAERWASAAQAYRDYATPRLDGLPRFRVLLSVPLAALVLGAGLVALGVNGSSSGAYFAEISSGSDRDLIAGEPQRIRSDEWNVGTVWTIAQVQQGLPQENHTFPGGMDPDLPYDLPHTGPSMVFKPHLWGFLALDVDHAVAWKWWMPGLALLAAAFMFAVTLLPRRPLVAAAIAAGFTLSPFVQWWYQTTTLWPLAWALVVMTATIWGARAGSARARWIWALPVGYLTVVMAMGVYAPFIIPVAYVAVFAAVGVAISALRSGMPVRQLLLRALPVLVGGIAGAVATLVWLRFKSDTVQAFLSTVYPGERLASTGEAGPLSVAQLMSSSFSHALLSRGGFLGLNSSEASTFFFIGIVLIPLVVWIARANRREKRPQPWLAIALTAVVVVFVLWLYLPGWDALSHLMLLDRTTGARLRIGLGLASLALLVTVIRELDGRRGGRVLGAVLGGGYLLSQGAIAVAVAVVLEPSRVWSDAPLWWVAATAGAAAIYFVVRGRASVAAVLFLVISATSTVGVHPLYSGVLDLRQTPVAQAVIETDSDSPGTWVGVGGTFLGAALLESGVQALNGTQGAPSREMWSEIDPNGTYEQAWNRIGAVRWTPGIGEPSVSNPAPDVILSTFDACSKFAQANVDYVLADTDLSSPCLTEADRFELPQYTVVLFDVTPSS